MTKKIFYCLIVQFCAITTQTHDYTMMHRPITYDPSDDSYTDGILVAKLVKNTNIYEAFQIVPRYISGEIFYHMIALNPQESRRVYKALTKRYEQNEPLEYSKDKKPEELE